MYTEETMKKPTFHSDVNKVSDKSTHGLEPTSLFALTCMILMHNWQTSSCVLGCWKTYEEGFRLKKKSIDFAEKTKHFTDKWNLKAKTQKTTLAVGGCLPMVVLIPSWLTISKSAIQSGHKDPGLPVAAGLTLQLLSLPWNLNSTCLCRSLNECS